MSREARLKRLGLWHLRDNEPELQKEIQRQSDEYQKYLQELRAKNKLSKKKQTHPPVPPSIERTELSLSGETSCAPRHWLRRAVGWIGFSIVVVSAVGWGSEFCIVSLAFGCGLASWGLRKSEKSLEQKQVAGPMTVQQLNAKCLDALRKLDADAAEWAQYHVEKVPPCLELVIWMLENKPEEFPYQKIAWRLAALARQMINDGDREAMEAAVLGEEENLLELQGEKGPLELANIVAQSFAGSMMLEDPQLEP